MRMASRERRLLPSNNSVTSNAATGFLGDEALADDVTRSVSDEAFANLLFFLARENMPRMPVNGLARR